LKYLRFFHPHGVCYIGRTRTEGEFMGELNKPQTLEEYQAAMNDVSKEIRELARYYSPNSASRWAIIAPKLLQIVEKHGY